jgi:tetratricopeptide (TPR) repeat protein
MMRSTALIAALAVGVLWLTGTVPAIAASNIATSLNPESMPENQKAHEQSRRLFDFGVRLYQEGNMLGALAEFEAAYKIHPNSAALQNLALCQKALYRYREAKASLEQLLTYHDNELSPGDRKTAQNVMSELAEFIGTVKVVVSPAAGKVAIDDRDFSPAELDKPLDLDVGEHHLRFVAEGYEPAQRTITVAGGTANPPLVVALKPTHGYLTILTPDDRTAIAIDGRAVAFESYRGFIEPGRHVIQIYRSGFEPYEAVVELEAGQSVTIRGKVGAALSETEIEEAAEAQNRPTPTPRQLRGWYGLVDASLLNLNGAPQDIEPGDDSHLGYSYGLHAGYRLFTPVGIEAFAGVTHHKLSGICSTAASAPYCFTNDTSSTRLKDPLNYTLDSRRVGGALRIMSGGEGIRFTSSIGVGAVSHDLHLPQGTLKGFDGYFALEAGAQVNIDHFLVEMVGFGWFDSASSIASGTLTPYQEGNGIQMFGLSLRVGWSEWTPRDARVTPTSTSQ